MKKLILSLFLIPQLIFGAETGVASYYSVKSNGGTTTASGQRLKDDQLTAAHKTLPFGTVVKITNLKNGKAVKAVINDDGPHINGRIIDVSQKAAEKLEFKKQGLARVKVEVVKLGKGNFRK